MYSPTSFVCEVRICVPEDVVVCNPQKGHWGPSIVDYNNRNNYKKNLWWFTIVATNNTYFLIMLPKVWSSLLTVNIAAFVTFVSTSLTILKKKKVKHKNVYAFIFVHRTNRTEITYFFSPSYNKNDSNVGGAFILKPRTILCFLQLLLKFKVLTSNENPVWRKQSTNLLTFVNSLHW